MLSSIRDCRVCLKGTLFTPLSRSTNTSSLNVQLRKELDLAVNVVHAFSIPGLPSKYKDLDIVVIRWGRRAGGECSDCLLGRDWWAGGTGGGFGRVHW